MNNNFNQQMTMVRDNTINFHKRIWNKISLRNIINFYFLTILLFAIPSICNSQTKLEFYESGKLWCVLSDTITLQQLTFKILNFLKEQN